MQTAIATKQPLTDDNYFTYPALNAGGINKFYQDPYEYWMASPFNPKRQPDKDSDEKMLGRLAHMLVLEDRKLFNSRYVLLPEGMIRNAKHKAYAEFLGTVNGRDVVTQTIFEQANVLATALLKNPLAKLILQKGTREEPQLVEMHGLPCKIKTDVRHDDLIWDYKTTRELSPRSYFKAAENMGYHRSASWYLDVTEIAVGSRPRGVGHIVQNKDFPDVIGFPVFTEEMINIGYGENLWAVAEIKRRLAANDWLPWPPKMTNMEFTDWYKAKGAHNG